MKRRETVQKGLVLSAVRFLGCHPSADEVYSHISKTHPSVSRGTVYRNLGILSEEKKIRRVLVANGKDRFDHNTTAHGHAICVICKKVYDIDIEPVKEMKDLLPKGFIPVGFEFVINGKCSFCASAE